jgi:hypothetical protein
MPGNSTECRRHALRCAELAMAARTPQLKTMFLELSKNGKALDPIAPADHRVPNVMGQGGRLGKDREPQLPGPAWLDRYASGARGAGRPKRSLVTGHSLQDVLDAPTSASAPSTKLAELERDERREKKQLKAVK